MRKTFRRLLLIPSAPITVITTLIVVAALFLSESFRSSYNLNNVIIQMVALGLVSLGQTYAILVGDVDLCLGGTISLVTVVSATLMRDSTSSMIMISCLALGLGVVIGVINGVLTTVIRIDAMVTTFATNTMLMGVALWIMEAPGGSIPYSFMKLVDLKVGFVPAPFVLLLALMAVSWYILDRTVFGFHVRAVGGGRQSAFTSGIDILKTKLLAHAIAGFMAALAGLFLSARMASGDALAGAPFSLDSMTAVVAGGTNFSTGVGSVIGTTIAAFLISVLGNILNHMAVSTYWQYVLKGMLLVVAVTAAVLRTRFAAGQRKGD